MENLQEALSQKDVVKILECVPEIAKLDEVAFAQLKLTLHSTFGSSFPMREFEKLVQVEKTEGENI